MIYKVEIIEELCRAVFIEADSAIEAEEFIRDEYNNDNICLDASDFTGSADFIVREEKEPLPEYISLYGKVNS